MKQSSYVWVNVCRYIMLLKHSVSRLVSKFIEDFVIQKFFSSYVKNNVTGQHVSRKAENRTQHTEYFMKIWHF